MRPIPILVYHSVSAHPAGAIAPFTVSPREFEAQMDAVRASGATTLTVSELADRLRRSPMQLPERVALVTFDDGFADFRDTALPAMLERGIRSTLYVTTGYVGRGGGPAMLGWDDLGELASAGVEIGGHAHTHPQLDTVGVGRARDEIVTCKRLLEDALGGCAVRSFAYPHGYSSPRVRRFVESAGFESACAVGNAFSHAGDDLFKLARLMVRATTTTRTVTQWVGGRGAPLAPRHERVRTRAWRAYRRTRAVAGSRDV